MTTHAVQDQQDSRPDPGQAPGERGAVVRLLLFAGTALVAAAVGVTGTLLYQRFTAPDTSGVDAQAAELAKDLRDDLRAGFYSPGHTFGGQFTEGTLVAQVEEHGGVLLSAGAARGQGRTDPHTFDVMLGLVPPARDTVAAGAYPVRCYRYTFALGAYSVEQSGLTCPALRTDGRPGSIETQMGALLAQQPTTTSAYRRMPTAGYAHTTQGAQDFLKDERLVDAKDIVDKVSGRAEGADVYALALRINGVCHYLRMDSSPSASHLIPLWAAPADEQEPCDVNRAVAATTLYGIDPAKAG